MNLVTAEQLACMYPKADERMLRRINEAVDLVNATANPAHISAHFDVDESLAMHDYVPSGNDIRKHLHGCREVIVEACTLGAGIDRLLERTRLIDLSLAYLIDQAASIAVENMAALTCRAIKQEAEQAHKRCTTRYSCGYGDYALDDQRDLLALCGADKALRITVNEGGMMYPTKSITYLVGLADER